MGFSVKKYTRSSLLAVAAAALLSGCAPVLIATGAAAGYAASRDSVVLDLDHPIDRVWEAAAEQVRESGTIKREDPSRRRVDAQVEGADVVVTVKPLTSSSVRVVVRARKLLMPKLEIAQRLAFAIQQRAERGGKLPF